MKTREFKVDGGIKLNCVDFGGSGNPPVLLIHGGAAHARWWDFVAADLIDRYHVLALDQRGHGDSEWSAEWSYGTRHYVADLQAVIEQLDLGAPALVGHSMGGHNVMCHAIRHSASLRAIAVIDSPPNYPEDAVAALRELAAKPSRRFDSLDEAIAGFRTIPADTIATPEILAHVAALSFRQGDDGKWDYKSDRRTMIRDPIRAWDGLKEIRCPALFVKPEKSVLPPGVAEKMVKQMPHGRIVTVPASHHHVPLDNPRGLAAALRPFLDDVFA
ncbi:alpha/beta hydrolase [bacterium]|nr:alpha/beta hydrolase [bacterium]